MPRKSASLTISAQGRDFGKSFLIEEMSAAASEAWAMRAIEVAAKSNINLPSALINGGLAGFAVLGLEAFSKAPYADKKPLLDEMMGCVKYAPEGLVPRALVDSDVEEVATLLKIREEVMQLHLGFFKDAVQLIRTVVEKALALGTSSNTSTSRAPSEPSSAPA